MRRVREILLHGSENFDRTVDGGTKFLMAPFSDSAATVLGVAGGLGLFGGRVVVVAGLEVLLDVTGARGTAGAAEATLQAGLATSSRVGLGERLALDSLVVGGVGLEDGVALVALLVADLLEVLGVELVGGLDGARARSATSTAETTLSAGALFAEPGIGLGAGFGFGAGVMFRLCAGCVASAAEATLGVGPTPGLGLRFGFGLGVGVADGELVRVLGCGFNFVDVLESTGTGCTTGTAEATLQAGALPTEPGVVFGLSDGFGDGEGGTLGFGARGTWGAAEATLEARAGLGLSNGGVLYGGNGHESQEGSGDLHLVF